jgi:hypothetical protein
MAVHFSCPHCQALLLLPENCGGQTTKCPGCGDSFMIPGGATTAPTPVCAVLAPVEGQVSESDVKRAREIFERLTAENVGLQVELARRQRSAGQLAVRLAWLKRFQAGRRALDHTIGRVGGFAVAVTLGAVLPIVLFSVFSLSAFGYFVVAVLGTMLAGLLYLPFSYYPDDVRLALLVPQLEARQSEAQRQHAQLAGEESAQRQKLASAETEYRRLENALSSRLHWLRTCQWRQMTHKNFVNFLKQVFEEHGYTVEPTGKLGQVGIDLVVVRDGARVAVQAKGMQAGTVDNRVVEQTEAGKARHNCQRAAIVTNAQFLPSARQLADRLGCKLIDGSQIPDLIEGRILV